MVKGSRLTKLVQTSKTWPKDCTSHVQLIATAHTSPVCGLRQCLQLGDCEFYDATRVKTCNFWAVITIEILTRLPNHFQSWTQVFHPRSSESCKLWWNVIGNYNLALSKYIFDICLIYNFGSSLPTYFSSEENSSKPTTLKKKMSENMLLKLNI